VELKALEPHAVGHLPVENRKGTLRSIRPLPISWPLFQPKDLLTARRAGCGAYVARLHR
jgi:hypothetical protein